jgi:GTP-binding protein
LETVLHTAPEVSIVGRPNVGKSTLFNRIIGRRMAIVDDRPGVTRDSLAAECRILGKRCMLVDTGGLSSFRRKSEIEQGVDRQILASMKRAALCLFVVDLQAGVVPEDVHVAETLRRTGAEVLLVGNKADGERHDRTSAEFSELALGEPFPVSALHGRNILDLLEAVAARLPETRERTDEERIRIAIVGRPNVGKSSITNAVLGQERCIVSAEPGTTRDSISCDFSWDGVPFTIVDTAGQRRRKSKADDIEYYSISRARSAIKRSNLCVLVLDAEQGLTEGDKRIASAIQEFDRGFLIAVNKMDLIKNPNMDYFIKNLLTDAPFLRNTPILFVSAMHREGMDSILKHAVDIHDRMFTLLPQDLLENLIYDIRAMFSPRSQGRLIGEIKGVLHDKVDPPRIVLQVNDSELFPPDYMKLIENRIREAFNLAGVPLQLEAIGKPKMKNKKRKK